MWELQEFEGYLSGMTVVWKQGHGNHKTQNQILNIGHHKQNVP